MANIYDDQYPGNWGAGTPLYPYGVAQDKTPGNNDGSYWDANTIKDIMGFLQGLLVQANITPNNTPDTAQNSQYVDAVKVLGAGYEFKGSVSWDGAAWQLTEASGTIGLSGSSTSQVPIIQRVSGDPLSSANVYAQVVATTDKSVVLDVDVLKDKLGLRLNAAPATGDKINFIKFN